MYHEFCLELSRTIDKCVDSYPLGFKFDGSKTIEAYIEVLKKKMLRQR